ncbi:MmgE/PrpD family protein [Paenarthrobacter sp. YAF11_1]|uniref:MmgE/PrpD family protein n=1 Tax=Paenarthrobacter sp. YAF11_1 TaxID=3233074 RepID=UPI003F9B98A8
MKNPSYARQLAIHATTQHPPTQEISDWMRLLLLDYLAVTEGGLDRESAKAARRSVSSSRIRTNDKPARVLGTERFLSVQDAALVNGITGHGLELDDTFEEASLHPGVVVFSALLAVADDQGHTLDDVLHAATVGYDVMCEIGILVGAAESYGVGFIRPAYPGRLAPRPPSPRSWVSRKTRPQWQ